MALSSNAERCADTARGLSKSRPEAGCGESRPFGVKDHQGQNDVGGKLPIVAADVLDPLRRARQGPEVQSGSHAPCGSVRHPEALPARDSGGGKKPRRLLSKGTYSTRNEEGRKRLKRTAKTSNRLSFWMGSQTDHLAKLLKIWSHRRESNPRPAVYKFGCRNDINHMEAQGVDSGASKTYAKMGVRFERCLMEG